MDNGLTEIELIEMVRQEVEQVSYARVYYTLRLMRVRPVWKSHVEKVRVCLALQQLGIPITTHTVNACLPPELQSKSKCIIVSLHNLGDKHILTLLRDAKMRSVKGMGNPHLRWIVSPVFLKHYKGRQQPETSDEGEVY